MKHLSSLQSVALRQSYTAERHLLEAARVYGQLRANTGDERFGECKEGLERECSALQEWRDRLMNDLGVGSGWAAKIMRASVAGMSSVER